MLSIALAETQKNSALDQPQPASPFYQIAVTGLLPEAMMPFHEG